MSFHKDLQYELKGKEQLLESISRSISVTTLKNQSLNMNLLLPHLDKDMVKININSARQHKQQLSAWLNVVKLRVKSITQDQMKVKNKIWKHSQDFQQKKQVLKIRSNIQKMKSMWRESLIQDVDLKKTNVLTQFEYEKQIRTERKIGIQNRSIYYSQVNQKESDIINQIREQRKNNQMAYTQNRVQEIKQMERFQQIHIIFNSNSQIAKILFLNTKQVYLDKGKRKEMMDELRKKRDISQKMQKLEEEKLKLNQRINKATILKLNLDEELNKVRSINTIDSKNTLLLDLQAMLKASNQIKINTPQTLRIQSQSQQQSRRKLVF